MHTNVENLDKHKLYKWTQEFVDVYEQEGDLAAGKYVHDNVEEKYRAELRTLVTEEFLARGYTFPVTAEQD